MSRQKPPLSSEQTAPAESLSTELAQLGFEGKAVRMVMDGDMPWFSASDVCKALGLNNTSQALADHVDEEDRNTVRISDVIRRGKPDVIFVNESGLYALIFGSKKPAAKRFKRWVTSEVLPSIRRTGRYEATQTRKTKPKPVRRGDFVLTPELFTRLYYALDKRLGATALVWYLLEQNAINVWLEASVREVSEALGGAIKPTSVHKFSHALRDEGVIGFKPGKYMVFSAVLKALLASLPNTEGIESWPGLSFNDGKLVLH